MPAVDEYFNSLDGPARSAFEHIRQVVMHALPDAEQGSSYGMAALKYLNKPLIGFRAAKGHLSIFPFSSEVVEAVRSNLTGFDVSAGTIRFTPSAPLPDDVVLDVVRLRRREIDRAA